MSHEIVAEIRADLNRMRNPDHADRVKQYFKEPIETHGLTAPQEKELAKKYHPRVKGDIQKAIEVAQKLIASKTLDEAQVGIRILGRMRRHLTPRHFDTLNTWVDQLTNWPTPTASQPGSSQTPSGKTPHSTDDSSNGPHPRTAGGGGPPLSPSSPSPGKERCWKRPSP